MATEDELREVRPRLLGLIDEARIRTVSIERPSFTAARLAPLPRCAITSRPRASSPSADTTYSNDRP